MLKIEHVETFGWETALRGMRNPKNSWERSDSIYLNDGDSVFQIGSNDMKLATTLAGAGQVHGKYLRMIVVSLDVTAPLYWWKEFDTYKVGTVSNSCSTMHKIHAKEFERTDFSEEHLIVNDAKTELLSFGQETNIMVSPDNLLNIIIGCLNNYRKMYLETKDKKWWWQMIQLLPSSYNQRRTLMLNYAVLKNIYEYRKDHKLDEWHVFCGMIRDLPYARELIIGAKE